MPVGVVMESNVFVWLDGVLSVIAAPGDVLDWADVLIAGVLDENCDVLVEAAAPLPRSSLDVMLGKVAEADGAAPVKGSPAVSTPYWLARESSTLKTLANIEENSALYGAGKVANTVNCAVRSWRLVAVSRLSKDARASGSAVARPSTSETYVASCIRLPI